MKTKISYCANCGRNTVWNEFKSNQFYKEDINIERYQCSNCGEVKEEVKNE